MKWKDIEPLYIDRSEIDTFACEDYYDGVVTGLVRYKGKPYLAQCMDIAFRGARVYWVIDVGEERMAKMLERHEAFERHVGTHQSYRANGLYLRNAETRPKEEWDKFYVAYPPGAGESYQDEDSVIGYFVGWVMPYAKEED